MGVPALTARERFLETMRFGKPDHVFLMPHWLFGDTVRRWRKEGLPGDVHLNTHFGWDRYESLPINLGPVPALETKVVEQTAHWSIVEDELGGRTKRWSDRELGMSQWLVYPIRDRKTWEAFKERLDPASPCRYPEYWDDCKRAWAERDYPLGVHGGSYYGWLRNWIGMEHIALWYFDDPELVREMTDYIADFVIEAISRAVDEVELDFALYWEDMAMKTGSLISPDLFREFMSPNYRRVNGFLRERGIDIHLVDCDGNVDELIPLWLEVGVNGVYPLEIAADCDPLAYREQYGSDLILFGGIDKRELARDKAAVEAEVMRRVPPMLEHGGYTPFVDHAVPPDVSYENFSYYMELVHDLVGG
jgi:hypothetical protein